MASIPNPRSWINKQIQRQVRSVISKVNYPTVGYGRNPREQMPRPPYERQIHPQWIYRLRQNSTLVNNSIEEKVSQTFRRGFTEWEKEYAAKCTRCKEKFESLDPFKEELGAYGDTLDDSEIDLDSPRICPECGELSEIKYPKESAKEEAEDFFRQSNEKTDVQSHLEPLEQNSVGQPFLEVCKELAWDIQSFDDAWLLFEREYITDPESGVILDYELKEVHRAPPELMRYSVQENGDFGGEYWVCPECRNNDNYSPEHEPTDCTNCGGYTYEVYALALEEPGGDPQSYFIRGEFVHASEYEPGKYYGYSPILTLWEESRTIEKMDDWYKDAYKERRAPRGAMLIRSSNAESVRSFNKKQMEQLRGDKHYIPTFIDDTEGRGKALEWVNLLEDPAEMQHMEMRDWFLERISAKYGVTPVFQKGSPNNSGLSQSLEIVVSNRSADRLRHIFNTTFIPAFIGQLNVDGWTRELRPVEEEDEDAEADVQGKYLQNASRAEEVGFEYEWTEEDRLKIYPGKPSSEEEGVPGGGGAPPMPPGAENSGDSPAEATGGAPGSPPGGQDPRIQESDTTVTTESSGWGNARYGTEDDEEIDVLGHLQELIEEEADKLNKSSENLSWNEIDISEYIKVWVDNPEDAPEKTEIVHDPENSPDNSQAEYYYKQKITTTNLGKIHEVNQNAEVVDFLWKPSPTGVINTLLHSKQDDEYYPYEPPEDCNRQYLESAGIDPSDIEDKIQIFEGPQDKKFYCQNWRQVGAWVEGEEGYDPRGEEQPIMDRDIVDGQLHDSQGLDKNENVFEFHGFDETNEGESILLKGDNFLERAEYVETLAMERVLLRNEQGTMIEEISDIEQKIIGTIHRSGEEYNSRYDNYSPPRDIYHPKFVESKERMADHEGGVNSSYTYEVEFDNGEEAIYKNYHGTSYDYTLDGEAAAYEISEKLSDSDAFPETARADLKFGFGSVQSFIENADTFEERVEKGPVDVETLLRNNVDRVAEMAVVDYLVGNDDRHRNNMMIDEETNLYAIDNGGHMHPGDDRSHHNILRMFKYFGQEIDEQIDDESYAEDFVKNFFGSLSDQVEDIVDEAEDSTNEIQEISQEFYGPTSTPTKRVEMLLDENDDGDFILREDMDEHLEKIKKYIIKYKL